MGLRKKRLQSTMWRFVQTSSWGRAEAFLPDGTRDDWYIIVGQNDTKFYLKPNETYQVDI
ncbi:hypothetical protein [Bacillus sp. EB600]|uniref:hypothetical protein n=1 Tax=Bacillus sp. EB600 TaxID=2806345 RepID=UPI00210C2692|nr:hypothetical protein [Bacillus sp. EB600]